MSKDGHSRRPGKRGAFAEIERERGESDAGAIRRRKELSVRSNVSMSMYGGAQQVVDLDNMQIQGWREKKGEGCPPLME